MYYRCYSHSSLHSSTQLSPVKLTSTMHQAVEKECYIERDYMRGVQDGTKHPDQRGWFFPALLNVGGDSVLQLAEAWKRDSKRNMNKGKWKSKSLKIIILKTHHSSVWRDLSDSVSFSWHAIYRNGTKMLTITNHNQVLGVHPKH